MNFLSMIVTEDQNHFIKNPMQEKNGLKYQMYSEVFLY